VILFRSVVDRPASKNVAFLFGSFDSAWPDMPDSANCLVGFGTQFDEEPRRDRPRAAETTAAMYEHAAAGSNNPARIGASDDPSSLEVTIRYRNVTDRQMNPSHPVSFDDAREPRDLEELEFAGLDQRHDHFRPQSLIAATSLSRSRSQPPCRSFLPGHRVKPMTPGAPNGETSAIHSGSVRLLFIDLHQDVRLIGY
jgi:hypothetical protein